MRKFSINVRFSTTSNWVDLTDHALLMAAWQFAEQLGVFKHWQKLQWKMKKVRYTPIDKMKTLWASIVVGCEHTYEINDKLGEHEQAIAQAVGLPRFPDQSQVNRWLRATRQEHLTQFRQVHLQLLAAHSRARFKANWFVMPNGEPMLVADIDQRALAVRGKQFVLAKSGYFGRKRGRRGYQLTALFLGGAIGEIVNEYFDPGDTQIGFRINDLIESLACLCKQIDIQSTQVFIRGDAALGTPAIIAQVRTAGFHFLFKGLSPQRARKLAQQASGTFWRGKDGAEGERRWISDLGEIDHIDQSVANRGAKVRARTILQLRIVPPRIPRPGAHRRRKKREGNRIEHSYYLTDLSQDRLPTTNTPEIYDSRATIERYFYDETYSLGAQHVRTSHFEGAALFQFLVATTNNLLRWMQHDVFKDTDLEKIGLGRLIHQAMQIPARLRQEGDVLTVEMPSNHHWVKRLQPNWTGLQSSNPETISDASVTEVSNRPRLN